MVVVTKEGKTTAMCSPLSSNHVDGEKGRRNNESQPTIEKVPSLPLTDHPLFIRANSANTTYSR